MRRKWFCSLAFLLAVCLALSACGVREYAYPENLNAYEITVSLDEQSKTAQVSQKITYHNDTGQDLSQLEFRVYAGAFARPETAPFDIYEWSYAYPNGFSPGGIEFSAVSVDGADAPYAIVGDDNTVMQVDAAVASGGSVQVQMQYTLTLPDSPGRFGYGEKTCNFGNCFPILSVFANGSWDQSPYYGIGDPFYSTVADYSVTVTLPEGMKIASTGKAALADEESNTYEISAPSVRDFAFVAGRDMQAYTDVYDGIQVISYAFSEEYGKKALEYAKNALATYTDIYGEYPYPTFTVAEADFFVGGMEYPNLVLINTELYNPAYALDLEYVVAHETAHQWWYAGVGNNQVKEPWLDEALTEYSTILYFVDCHGVENAEQVYDAYVQQKVEKAEEYLITLPEEGVGGGLDTFESNVQYDALVYGKGAMMFRALHKELGETFVECMRQYYAENLFKTVTVETLIDKVNEITQKDYSDFFVHWLSGTD